MDVMAHDFTVKASSDVDVATGQEYSVGIPAGKRATCSMPGNRRSAPPNISAPDRGQGCQVFLSSCSLPLPVARPAFYWFFAGSFGKVEVDRQGAGKLVSPNTPPPSPCCRRASY